MTFNITRMAQNSKIEPNKVKHEPFPKMQPQQFQGDSIFKLQPGIKMAVANADGTVTWRDAGKTVVQDLNDSTRIITTQYQDGNRLKYELNPQTGETKWIENTYKGIKNDEQ